MQATTQNNPWIEANQALLVQEFARLKGLFDPESSRVPSASLNQARAALPAPAAIDRLSELFGLSAFERDVILLCAGVEMDSTIAALCAEAQGRPERPYLTFGLAIALLPEPHWSALTPSRPLRQHRMVELETNQGLTSCPLRIDERILHYLAGVNLLDRRLQPLLQHISTPLDIADDHRRTAGRIVRAIEINADGYPVFHLSGDDSHGQEDTAAIAAKAIGRSLFVLRADDIPAASGDLEQLALLWEREALLLPGALLIDCSSGGFANSSRRLTERLRSLLFLSSREPLHIDRPLLRFDVDKPQPAEQKRLWHRALGTSAIALNGTLDSVTQQFKLSARNVIYTASLLNSDQESDETQDLWNACRSLARPKLDDLAQRILATAQWDDLVLPELQKQALLQITSQVRHRMKVYDAWGFANKGRRGLGVSALFTGESGTGKTMAAEILAGELNLDLYRVDLSAVVSKYIGETEKNLKQVFDAAEAGGALLLFDEADALFGKRSDVKDSHDRYANIEVSYLLERMESYRGLAILTTNLKSVLDKAFQRRLRFIVNFPFPDAAQREAIWMRIFPAKTPTQGLDYKRLSQLNIAGGNIRNIALNAAFLAAAETIERPVQMEHLFRAAMLETQKIERALSVAEVRGWV